VLVAVLAQRFRRAGRRRGDAYPGAGVQVIDAEYEIVAARPANDSPPEKGDGGNRDQ
jgi:hypothetical protein